MDGTERSNLVGDLFISLTLPPWHALLRFGVNERAGGAHGNDV